MGGNSRAAIRRAALHGDGWVPWVLTPDQCATAVALARRLRAEAARPDTFEVVAPLAVPEDATSDDLARAAADWRKAGATAFHVGSAAGSLDEFVDRLAWFGREVISRTP